MSITYPSTSRYLYKLIYISITYIGLETFFGSSTQGHVEANGSYMELVNSGIYFIKSIGGNIKDETPEDKTLFAMMLIKDVL